MRFLLALIALLTGCSFDRSVTVKCKGDCETTIETGVIPITKEKK